MTFQPTHHEGYPTTCYCCGRHATGIGIGAPNEPKWLCEQCIMLLDQIKDIRSFNGYERAAVTLAVESVGQFLDQNGTDLSEWSEEQAAEFVKEIWMSCGDGLRKAIRVNGGRISGHWGGVKPGHCCWGLGILVSLACSARR